ncbi:PRC-barrel domain-containing protein [Bosea sp. ANAM02]|uniref:PRC-barrel domain-containing protein n=1 Tax=Bosea sp. ANAM02 TaxID=2020412 RepID=UPI00140F39F3|nr:PRC-barrel domain-containing protein [Bosea sp. ANAM02]BCB20077.1 photosystem reaction center subunit H [Bosea sp. ANAM02]
MIRHHHFMLSTVGVAMLATAAMAQTSAPTPPSSTPAAPTATQPSASAPADTKAETNLAGQGKWRTSKLIGVDIYGPDDKKVGDITEVIVDKTGKVDMVTIGVGGFLGIGAKDVAVPFDQVNWSDQPMAAPAPAPAPAGSASSTGGGMASPPATAAAPKAPAMYPDHGKITMTKDQLKSAPSVTYSGT